MSEDDGTKRTNGGQQNISPTSSGSTENKTGEGVEASGAPDNETGTETSNPGKPSRIRALMDKHFPHAKSHDRWTLLFTCVIAVSSALYTLFAGWTLHEIRSGSADTHDLAIAAAQQASHTEEIAQAAQDQVDAANEISDAADSFSETSETAVEEFKKAAADSVAASKRAANNAERAITEATNNSKIALRISERPYITIENVRFDPALDSTKNFFFIKFDMHDSGRTPALKVTKEISAFIDGIQVPSTPNQPEDIIVAADRSATASETLSVVNPFSLLRIIDGTSKLSIKGKIVYIDIFKDAHDTTFCATWDKGENVWKYCPGNDVN
jgi:hypothetical protein